MYENINLKNMSSGAINDKMVHPPVDMHLEDVLIVRDQGEDHGDVPSRH
ncbi:hypothetical protein [Clostridium aminobutyricum]|uniref:Uncharacterized protein n=1 Tax=Clostridium aminobutyricum TaxID=33953 RepID=A0A939IHV5_CLOAM|nr:hypothetical protein [Clostridium aminobutyricum]MBN7771854.1 hypothetical protein [Clostridium aminobutyricum]